MTRKLNVVHQMTEAEAADKAPITINAASIPAAISLPSGNIVHAAVYKEETHNRMQGFEAGIIALSGEIDGQQATYEAAKARLIETRDRAIARATEECRIDVEGLDQSHYEAKRDLLRRLDDLNRGKRMAAAALDAADEGQQQA